VAGRPRDQGIDRHIVDLKALFVFAPDITIKVPPMRRRFDRRGGIPLLLLKVLLGVQDTQLEAVSFGKESR
jgi:hypothetical protein